MRAPVCADTAFFGEFIQKAEGDELFGEIAHVQFFPQQRLVQRADLAEGEFRREEVIANGIMI